MVILHECVAATPHVRVSKKSAAPYHRETNPSTIDAASVAICNGGAHRDVLHFA